MASIEAWAGAGARRTPSLRSSHRSPSSSPSSSTSTPPSPLPIPPPLSHPPALHLFSLSLSLYLSALYPSPLPAPCACAPALPRLSLLPQRAIIKVCVWNLKSGDSGLGPVASTLPNNSAAIAASADGQYRGRSTCGLCGRQELCQTTSPFSVSIVCFKRGAEVRTL
jgi:hypothetical protein